MLIIEARKCAYCGLIFRYPTDSPGDAEAFYDKFYTERQEDDLPKPDLLRQLKDRNFGQSEFDKAHRVRLIKSLRPSGTILDYGCSWGYTVYQLAQAGYQSMGFEFSRPMADYGRRNLNIDIRDRWNELLPSLGSAFDIIYTDHVLEHTYDLRQPLDAFSSLLKPSGTLVIFVPNGGGLVARREGTGWRAFIGEAHTIAFSPSWFKDNLAAHGFVIEELYSVTDGVQSLTDGEELVCIARRRTDNQTEPGLKDSASSVVCNSNA